MDWHGSMVVCFVAVSVVGSACAPGSAPQSPAPGSSTSVGQPKRIVAVIGGEPSGLHHAAAREPGADAVDELVSAGLLVKDNAAQFRPELAEAVPSVENGLWKLFPDGRMEMTWTIRPGARWHDGTPITSADAVFTARVAQDRNLPFFSTNLRFLDSVEAPDERTVVARWSQPFIEADRLFADDQTRPLPRHLLEQTFGEGKDSFMNSPHWYGRFVGSGPFQVRELVRGSHLVLDAFDGYVLGRPKVDAIEVRFILDANTAMANILSGEVELTLGDFLSLEQSVQLRDQWKAGRMETDLAAMKVFFSQFIDPTPRIWLNVQFRRALYHTLDRQQWIDSFFYGLTTPSLTVLTGVADPTGILREMEAGVIRYDYDPRRAAQLLEGLGLSKGADGFYQDASGQRLAALEVRAPGEDDESEKVVFATVDGWQRLGIASEVNIVPRQLVANREYRATRPGLLIQGGNHGLDSLIRFQGNTIPSAATNWVGGNGSNYASPELDALYDRYLTTIPMRERAQVVNQILRHYNEWLPYLPLYKTVEPTMIANRLLNVYPSNSWATQAWNAHEWDVR